MKKYLLFFILGLQLFAFDSATASKIFDKIFHAMLNQKEITVYTMDEDYQKVIIDASELYLCTLASKSDIILVNKLSEVPKGSENRLLFATSYLVYKENKNAVGAFYWDRGHIKIEFSRQRLLDKNIHLPQSFDKYIKDDLL